MDIKLQCHRVNTVIVPHEIFWEIEGNLKPDGRHQRFPNTHAWHESSWINTIIQIKNEQNNVKGKICASGENCIVYSTFFQTISFKPLMGFFYNSVGCR